MNRNKRYTKQPLTARTRSVGLLLCVLAALVACSADPLAGEQRFAGQYQTVSIDLLPPGGFEAYTRGMTDAQENAIANKAVVLQFERTATAEKLVGWEDADIAVNEGKTILKVRIKSSLSKTQRYDLVVVANSSLTAASFAAYADQTKEQVRIALPAQSYTTKWGTEPIPLWAEAADVIVSPQSNVFTLPLLRSLARIDIGLGTYDAVTGTWAGLTTAPHTFTLQKVYLFNVNNRFTALPAPANLNSRGAAIAPTVPSGTGLIATTVEAAFDYSSEIADGKQLTSVIYLPEADNKNTADKQQRTILVIGGSYGGKATVYYRIDLLDDDRNAVNVLRNHCYRFSVIAITHPGYETVQAAFANPPINATPGSVALNPIDEGEGGDVAFDNTTCLSVSNSELQIYGDNSVERTVEVATVRADYPAGVTPQVSSTLPGATLPTLISGVRVPLTATIPARIAYGNYTYTIALGKLSKTLKVRLMPGPDVHFDKLPFANVAQAEITSSDGTPGWIALSTESDYKPDKQYQQIASNPNTDGKLYVHIDENIAQPGEARTATVRFARKDGGGTLKAVFEQPTPAGLLLGYFGGDDWLVEKNSGGYPKQLMVERVEEYSMTRLYDDGSFSSAINGIEFGFMKVFTGITDWSFGRAVTRTLAERTDAGISPYAARYCYEKNRDADGSGTIEDNEVVWYLPSLFQLMGIQFAQVALDAPLGPRNYWNSMETSEGGAWLVNFNNGTVGEFSKSNGVGVRCVRDIEIK